MADNDEQEYNISITVNVTATSPQEALKYALDDLRDMNIDGHWTANCVDWCGNEEEVTQEGGKL